MLHKLNLVRLYIKSMGKVFRVIFVAHNAEQANEFCRLHNDCGVIAEDKNGLIYIAELNLLTVPSNVLPD